MLSCFRKENTKKIREAFFMKNGALVLERLIHDFNGNCNPIRVYTAQELSSATNKWGDNLIHQDWNSMSYKGVHEGQEILVKTFQHRHSRASVMISSLDDPVELITNEVAIASNMSNHRNFLKLIGCCLETELPTLVFEFPAKGNLSSFKRRANDPPTWQVKLNIAIQVADALSYLHYGTTKVIIHRDIKMGHIFLDQDYVAKLSEFQTSISIPLGESHVDIRTITGTQGFIAPEYMSNSSPMISEKTDVYGFGMLLLELFALNKGVDSFMEIRSVLEIASKEAETYLLEVNNNNLENVNEKQLVEWVKLVRRCLGTNPDERPSMKEVAQSLRLIKSL